MSLIWESTGKVIKGSPSQKVGPQWNQDVSDGPQMQGPFGHSGWNGVVQFGECSLVKKGSTQAFFLEGEQVRTKVL